MAEDQEYDALYQAVRQFAKERNRLARVAKVQYEPMIDSIIRKKISDAKQIDFVLDRVLDFCFDDEMLALFKRLCRYYYPLDPDAVASYVRAYREMWEDDPDNTYSSESQESAPPL